MRVLLLNIYHVWALILWGNFLTNYSLHTNVECLQSYSLFISDFLSLRNNHLQEFKVSIIVA